MFKCIFKCMNYITTTQLRTNSSDLVKALLYGESIDLIHRSKIIGEIRPKIDEPKVFDAKRFLKLAKELNLPKTTPQQRERIYRNYLEKRYGKGISRH